ncbi:MAG: glycosyltransferase 87 family protein [Chloroflexota bacterium]
MNLPIDVLLLLAVVPAYLWGFRQEMILMAYALAGYLGVAMWHPLSSYWNLPTQGRGRYVFLLQWMLLLIIITGAAVIPTLNNVLELWSAEIDFDGYTPAYREYHDGAIQIAEAVRLLDEGKNPYVETYENTPLRFFGFQDVGEAITENPALDYLAYLPGFLWLSWPAYKLAAFVGLPYDQRLVYLLFYIVLILLLPHLTTRPSYKLALTIAVGLNPLLVKPIITGMNDAAVLMFVIGSVLLLRRNKWVASALFFGIACSLKQFAWFIAPFYLLLAIHRENGLDWKRGLKMVVIMGVVMFIVTAPFAVWDWQAFFEDVFLYPGGQVGVNYPILGYTVGTLLIGVGVIPSHYSDFPFMLLQLIFGMPLLIFLLHRQWRNNYVGEMFLFSGIFVFGLGLVSRFFQDNYIGFVAVLISVGLILRDRTAMESISDGASIK